MSKSIDLNRLNFGLSLELVEMDNQEPNRNQRESKYYWDEMFQLVSAAGFTGIELPYQPKWDFGGRSGVPFSNYAITTKYGTVKSFLEMLNANGIEKIVGIHFDPSLFISDNFAAYFGAFNHFASEAIRFAAESGAGNLTLTPTPCQGLLQYYTDKQTDWSVWSADFIKKTSDLVARLADEAAASGVTLNLKNEYWSLLRGNAIDDFIQQTSGALFYDIDTAHLQISGLNPVEQIHRHAGKIGSVHLSDTAFVDDGDYFKSTTPEYPAGRATQVFRDIGQGTVDLAAACSALLESDYQGWVVCNNSQTRDTMRAMLRTRFQINNSFSKH